MKLKRIAALGAVVLSSLAIPTTALASTTGSPPRPVAIKVMCPPVRLIPAPAAAAAAAITAAKPVPAVSVRPIQVAVCCGIVKSGNGTVHRAVCPPATVIFDMPAGGRTLTEMRGPRLFVREAMLYRGSLYTVTSVRGSRFTLGLRGKPFVNHGAAIRGGRALILRGPVAVVTCSPRPPK